MYVVTKRLTQWGSKELGDKGLTPIEILRYFYGDDMYINIAPEISGMAGICIGDRVKRRKGEADTGAVECNCGSVSCDT